MLSLSDQVIKRYVSRSGMMFEEIGLTRIAGELGALLYLTKGPLSLEEASEKLQVSKSSVSTNAKFLQRMKYIRIVKKPGDRKDYYQFSGNLWPSLKEVLDTFIRTQVNDFKELNNESIPQLDQCDSDDEGEKEKCLYLIEQLRDLRALYYFSNIVTSMTDLFKTKSYSTIHGIFKNTIGKTVKKILKE
jgi:DNA-binding transcriptional regulator GbsR (MarR family)